MRATRNFASSLTVSENGVGWIAVPAWNGFDWLWHGFSTHIGGVSSAYLPEGLLARANLGQLNLGFTAADAAENVRENRLRWIEAVTGSRETPLATIRQVHSNCSVILDEGTSGATFEADGIMTGRLGVLLGIQTADCIPVLVADPVKRAVADFHAGWRGTVERIVELGIARMQAEFGSDPADLVAAIGPGIGPCCYAVGTEVLERFRQNFSYAGELFSAANEDGDRTPNLAQKLDLVEANRRQLLDAGLKAESISIVGGCTACQPELFYSHRASGGHAGRMMAVIGIRG
jgi:YfiH family protein